MIDFNEFDTRIEFSNECLRKEALADFSRDFHASLTPTAVRIIGEYLFGAHRNYAAAAHFLSEIAKPAAERAIENHRLRTEL